MGTAPGELELGFSKPSVEIGLIYALLSPLAI
jgi:hypothetical protein